MAKQKRRGDCAWPVACEWQILDPNYMTDPTCPFLSGLGRYERNPSDEDVLVLGRDLSGVVAEVGLEVHHLAVGDKVWGLVPITQPTGAMTDYVVLNAAHVRRKPPKIGHEGKGQVYEERF